MACSHAACPLYGALPASADERGRCRRCGQTLPGHRVPGDVALEGAAMQEDAAMQEVPSGATQSMAALQMDVASGVPSPPTVLPEMLHHFQLIQPLVDGSADARSLPIRLPTGVIELQVILTKLGYHTKSQDMWEFLGFAKLEGPDPTDVDILARGRAASTLISLISASDWPQDDVMQAKALMDKVSAAVAHCEVELARVLKERRRFRPDLLHLFKELGIEALAAIKETAQIPRIEIYTQWSDVLRAGDPDARTPAETRVLAVKAEKGNEAFWDDLAGKSAVFWTPSDNNSLTRLLAAFCGVPTPPRAPLPSSSSQPSPRRPVLNSISNITDVCHFPLLSSTWFPIVKDVAFIPFLFEVVSPTMSGIPRVGRQGLALFSLRFGGLQTVPRLINMASLLQLPEVKAVTFDLLVDGLPDFLSLCSLPLLTGTVPRARRRSPLSTSETPRISVDLVFPSHLAHFDVISTLGELRRAHLPGSTFFGLKGLVSDSDTFILECNGQGVFRHYWPLCSQVCILSPTKFLLVLDASAGSWKGAIGEVWQQDAASAATRLKRRPSRFGGRVIAAPAAVAPRAAAAKRRAGKAHSISGYLAEIRVQGEIGLQDNEVLNRLMQHAVVSTGLSLSLASDPDNLQAGGCAPVGRGRLAAARGVIKVLTKDKADVRKLHGALRNKAVQVGQGPIHIQVRNDLLELAAGERSGAGLGIYCIDELGHSSFAVFVVFHARVPSAPCLLIGCFLLRYLVHLLPLSHGRGQFQGGFSMTFWNAQALFASDVYRFSAKSAHVHKLLQKSDICLITEAHGSETRNSTWRAPLGTTAWWSEGASAGRAGVGVVVRDSFLKQFSEQPLRVHMWRGRAAKLCLRGPMGAFDIMVVHGHAGSAQTPTDSDMGGVLRPRRADIHSLCDIRSLLRSKISDSLSPAEGCLALLGGDFNWVIADRDRIALRTMEPSGHRDARSERQFKATVGDEYGFAEMF
ncbi:unnamed protein product [Prorocentrum cordatum]|uniref:Endonuclease/exonuclease/phosphatase domain-containing protein n=1 Tax=Prorocentrum cordatum TaxID=2364126 RepID=A0ABN9RE88_9DINO|nr:unnamed protein product [Polarella glacialis]